jgi:hypothetical protein
VRLDGFFRRIPSYQSLTLSHCLFFRLSVMQHKKTVIGGFSDGGLGEVKYHGSSFHFL